MRKDLKQTEGIFPMPVLMIATYNEDGSVNVMNAAWGTLLERNIIELSLAGSHKTVKNILAKKAFTVSLADASHVVEADYFGITSGNQDLGKFAKSGMTASKAPHVDAPLINEFPIAMECELIEYMENETLLGKIVNISAEEGVLREDGKVDVAKLDAIAFDPYTHGYYKIGERVGDAFKDGLQIRNK